MKASTLTGFVLVSIFLLVATVRAESLATTAPAGAAQTTQPAQKPDLTSDAFDIGDYSTVLLCKKLQAHLGLSDDQRDKAEKLRSALERAIETAASRRTHGREPTVSLMGRAKHVLAQFGQKARDLLTPDQDQKVQQMFEKGQLTRINVEVESLASKIPVGPNSFVIHGIRVEYCHFGEGTPDSQPATNPSDTHVSHAPPHVLTHHGREPQLPEGVEHGEFVGSTEGLLTYAHITPKHAPVIGFAYKLGKFSNDQVFKELTPVSEQPDGGTSVCAKDGYAVGALVVDTSDQHVLGIRIVFMRLKDGRLDPKDSYKSDWIGQPSDTQTTLDSSGKPIIGICGRKGVEIRSIAIVVESHAAGQSNK